MFTGEYIRKQTKSNERTFRVYRDSGRSYDNSDASVGETNVWLFDASASSSIVTEGADEDTSLTGFLRPINDGNPTVAVGDELRLSDNESLRYTVRTKVGVPTELEPTVWQLGIDRANEE